MVFLKELTEKDLVDINNWRNNKDIIDLLGANFRYINIETDIKWFTEYQQNRNNQVRCGIYVDDYESIVGLVSLTGIDHLNSNAELHIMIGEEKFQNRGIGSSAISLMLKHAFYNLNLNKIYLSVLEDNLRAIKAYNKIGFVNEGILKEHVYKNGEYKNLNLMAIKRQEYSR